MDDLCNFVHLTFWFPLRRVWGEPERFMDGGGGCAATAVSGGDAWLRNVPAEQVEQPLPAWFQRGGLGLVFLCQ